MLYILKHSLDLIKRLRQRDPYIDELYKKSVMSSKDRNILINELANRYCLAFDNNDERGKDVYGGGLLLQSWKPMINFYKKVKVEGSVKYEDLPSIFWLRLDYTCRYRRWQDLDENGNPRCTAQQCINMCIATEAANVFGRSNWHCNKSNVPAFNVSIDTPIGSDSERTLGDIISDPSTTRTTIFGLTAEDIVNDYFDRKKADMAIVIDAMIFNSNSSKVVKEDGKCHSEISELRLKKVLKNLVNEDIHYYTSKYHVDENLVKETIQRLASYKSNELSKIIYNTRQSLQNLKEVLH